MTILDKKIGWSSSGKLITGDRLRQVSLQADFPRAETYVLQFTKGPRVGAGPWPVRAEAFITWSVEGNSVTRRVSLANGITVQGVAQAVRVVIKDVTDPPVGAIAPPPVIPVEYEVSVQVTVGTRGSNQFPPFLLPSDGWSRTLIPVNTLSLPIPPDAGVTSFITQATGLDPMGFQQLPPGALMVFMRQGTNPLSIVQSQGPQSLVPILPGADNLLYVFQPAFAPAFTVVTLTTLFGIDG